MKIFPGSDTFLFSDIKGGRMLVQRDHRFYELVLAYEIESIDELDTFLEEHDVRLLKEKEGGEAKAEAEAEEAMFERKS